MNADIVRLLREIAHLRGEKSNAGIAYENAAQSIAALSFSIRASGKDASTLSIPGVGPKISAVIMEYIRTGTFEGANELRARAAARDALMGIIDVGEVTAEEWIRAGILSIADLRRAHAEGRVSLKWRQELGLQYYDDLNSRIPRTEIAEIEAVVRGLFAQVSGDTRTHITTVGSYRRGLMTSGDVDILIYRDIYRPKLLLNFAEALPQSYHLLSSGQERLSYLYKHATKMRQIDILMVKKSQSAAALLYFTGSWNFNAAMRAVAKKKGYRLNQHGLFRMRGGRVSTSPIVTPTEKSIFDALSLEYIEPQMRADAPKHWLL